MLVIILVQCFITNPGLVERHYSNGFYIYLSKGVRFLLGPFPFSVGDLFYMALIVWLVWSFYSMAKQYRKEDGKWGFLWNNLQRILLAGCWIWLCFHSMWGVNYYRKSIPEQFGLEKKKPEKEELERFAQIMLDEVNQNASARERDHGLVMNAERTKNAYLKLAEKYPSLHYTPVSFKPSLFGSIGNYMGYSGYFNPISGEAQVNDRMPDFTQPFTGLHEVAHQLGYAKESDASFIGFLAAYHSGDSSFMYSAALEMFLFADGALYRFDSTRAKALKKALPRAAKRDLESYKAFYRKYQGPIDDLTTWFYAHFLRWNNQPEGMYSYNRSMVYVLRYILDNPSK